MSLVNDMLRDLDARRRDAPARGARAEKLVPAAEDAGRGSSRRQQRLIMAAVITLAAAAVAAVALYLGATRDSDGRTSLPVAQTAAQSEPTSDADSGTGNQASQQLQALTARMETLEAENRLLQQQGTAAGPASRTADNDDGAAGDGGGPTPENLLAVNDNRNSDNETDWQPRDWSATQQEEEEQGEEEQEQETGVSPQADAESQHRVADGGSAGVDPSAAPPDGDATEETVTRTPREPSFAERDRRQVQDALTLWSNGQRTEALEALDQFTMDNPQAHQSREMLGKLLLQRGETGIAMQVADIGLQIAPMHNGYRKLKSRLLMGLNRPEEALELLGRRPPSTEGDTEYHELLATAALASRRYRAAQRSYEGLLGMDDSEGRWWYGLATALEGQGQNSNATRAYQRAQRSSTLSSRLRQRSEERIAQLTAQ